MRIDEAVRLIAAMERESVEYVMVGSMAMAVNGLVRATRDVDFMVAADEDNIARLRSALRSVFDDPDIDQLDARELAGDYPVVQYFPPNEAYSVDIIARLGHMFSYDDIEWHWMNIEGVRVKVATPRMLYVMKRDTVREQDRVDARRLKEQFALEDD